MHTFEYMGPLDSYAFRIELESVLPEFWGWHVMTVYQWLLIAKFQLTPEEFYLFIDDESDTYSDMLP